MKVTRHIILSTTLTITILGLVAPGQDATSKPAPSEIAPRIGVTQPAQRDYRNGDLGFSFIVPDGWKLSEKSFTHSHYTNVFLTVNSMRPGLQIQEQVTERDAAGMPIGWQFSPKTTLEQMMPGEVYLSVAYADGPGGSTMQADTVDADLRPLLTNTTISVSAEPNLSELQLSFFKRAHRWAINVYLREPITGKDRQKVMSILESWRFFDAPVNKH